MAGTTQKRCARRDASGSPSGCRPTCRDRPVRHNPSVAQSVGVDVSPISVRDAAEIERAISAFARASGRLIVTASALARVHINLIITLAARHKLPAVYWDRPSVVQRRPDFLWL